MINDLYQFILKPITFQDDILRKSNKLKLLYYSINLFIATLLVLALSTFIIAYVISFIASSNVLMYILSILIGGFTGVSLSIIISFVSTSKLGIVSDIVNSIVLCFLLLIGLLIVLIPLDMFNSFTVGNEITFGDYYADTFVNIFIFTIIILMSVILYKIIPKYIKSFVFGFLGIIYAFVLIISIQNSVSGWKSSFLLFITILVTSFKIYYIIPHLMQYNRAKKNKDESFNYFKNSPIYWDEVILFPLPFLSDFLVRLTDQNKKSGLEEIKFVSSKRPNQKKASVSALLDITIQDLSKQKTIEDISKVQKNISFFPSFESNLSKEFSNIIRSIENISEDATEYINSTRNYNKKRNINILLRDVDFLKNILIVTQGPIGSKFSLVAEKWSQIINEENKKLETVGKNSFEEIPNPYIFGNPIRPDNTTRLFVGRRDIINEIELNLSNVSQKPSIFLNGRRRVGKSSVLLNLPKFLGKQFVSAYIDCQDARTRESHASFFYIITKSISNSFEDRGYHVIPPSLDDFKSDPFTIFGEWLDELEKILEKEDKLVLITFDEFEKIEESITKGSLSIEILEQLRNIIQHREHIIILITGTREFNELELNWSDYLISAKVIKIYNLSIDEARILITNPIDNFTLEYEGGEKGDVVNRIVDVTNGHPYLIQALCFEIVNYLNTQERNIVTMDDISIAIERVIISSGNYFYYIWNSECSESEKDILIKLLNNPLKGNETEINSLLNKEIIEIKDGNYSFKVKLMKKWIENNQHI